MLQLCGAAALEGVNLVVGPRFASMKNIMELFLPRNVDIKMYIIVYTYIYICFVCVFISDYIEDLSNVHLYLKFKCVLSCTIHMSRPGLSPPTSPSDERPKGSQNPTGAWTPNSPGGMATIVSTKKASQESGCLYLKKNG